MPGDGPTCGCGQALTEWAYATGRRPRRVWCADLEDLLRYRRGQPTGHDVRTPGGERIQPGRCQDPPPPHLAEQPA